MKWKFYFRHGGSGGEQPFPGIHPLSL
jgi:hypothetical protein